MSPRTSAPADATTHRDPTTANDLPDADETLALGVMQHWSDAEHHPAGDSFVLRQLLTTLCEAKPASVLVAGPHSLDLVLGLREHTPALTVLSRGRPDAHRAAEALADTPGAESICGDLDSLVAAGRQFDLVVALDDVRRIPSAETGPRTWRNLAEQLVGLVSPTGRLLWAVENDLGLHRLGAALSDGIDSSDAAWAPVLTDPTRPTGADEVRRFLGEHGLRTTDLVGLASSWSSPRVFRPIDGPADEDRAAALAIVRDTLVTGAMDPARVVLPAAQRGLLHQFGAGWLVVATGAAAHADPVLPWAGPVVEDGHRVVDVGRVSLPEDATLLLVSLLEQCVAHDVAGLRRDLRAWVAWLRSVGPEDRTGVEGIVVGRGTAGDEPHDDGVMVTFVPGVPGEVADVGWRSLAQLVGILRRTGLTHPWPSHSDDSALLIAIGTLAGLEVPDDVTAWLPVRDDASDLPSRSQSAMISRLQEQNVALTSRAAWFERRLNEREHEIRLRDPQHVQAIREVEERAEAARRAAHEVRRSPTFRIGRVMIAPLRLARAVARRLGL
ncbi:hypothetical protein [Microlunatus sp. Y2014]|uniref:hypothetical protein n=1 Tax=Microlunatus sp. Y2014 TaxID=3418488 RepID=UPI003DA6E6D7